MDLRKNKEYEIKESVKDFQEQLQKVLKLLEIKTKYNHRIEATMKHFLKTQLIAAPYIASITFLFYFIARYNLSYSVVIVGFIVFLFVSIILTVYLSEARWITILYSLINFIIDTVLLFFMWFYFPKDDSSILLLIIITYPITIVELIFGSVIGIAISRYFIEKKNEKQNIESEVNE